MCLCNCILCSCMCAFTPFLVCVVKTIKMCVFVDVHACDMHVMCM